MAETQANNKYPLLIFINGPPGSFAQEIGRQLALDHGFFYISISKRFNFTRAGEPFLNSRHAALPYINWQMTDTIATFLKDTKHLQTRPCLVIEGYPRHTSHIPTFWRDKQRLFIYCDCDDRAEAKSRAVGKPKDWDPNAPSDGGRMADGSWWQNTPIGREYGDAGDKFEQDWCFFTPRIAGLLGRYLNDREGGSQGWRAVHSTLTPGKVVTVKTAEGSFEECYEKAKGALDNSMEFQALLGEIGEDFETMADDDEDEA